MSDRITGTTVLTGLLGSPVAHSISPLMHNASFAALGLDYAYLCFDVGTDRLKEAVEGLRAMGARGWNLTMPDKNLMCQLADKLSPASEISGAVNTIVNDDGVLTGYTTDGTGYMRAAEEAGFPLPGKVMTLLGGGGAATAILVQAALDGMKEIRVFNRKSPTFDRLSAIAGQLNRRTDCLVTVHPLEDTEDLRASIADSDILTNATNIGMAPHTDACPIPDASFLRPELIVSDIIYNPRQTKLLQMAKETGCPFFNGLYMLLYQGAASFELWTGREMPVELIKEKYFAE
ncbi:MAG TPA: shikimate dehydrogenase [Candidatus Anaerobutyricum stercoripullorum]|uniref:Shikimate dehydrogenase (NADP(+)) n=1 Tax=Candidatus Anaerobutyricum stercoripullorum TaxID=2838456 RepID=A0A9D1X5D5_9FIRM|nr:shikimate dehydrogenase [Candidatus Anaerobutyricum stercoripullorum]